MSDTVNHPEHYTSHVSGIECIEVTQHMNFCLGNAVKYIWRADLKGGVEDLKKAAWYIDREIQLRDRAVNAVTASGIAVKVTADGRFVADDGETFDTIEEYDNYVNGW